VLCFAYDFGQLDAVHSLFHVVVHNHQVEAGLARGGALEQQVLREKYQRGVRNGILVHTHLYLHICMDIYNRHGPQSSGESRACPRRRARTAGAAREYQRGVMTVL